jgi:hypothetical protein
MEDPSAQPIAHRVPLPVRQPPPQNPPLPFRYQQQQQNQQPQPFPIPQQQSQQYAFSTGQQQQPMMQQQMQQMQQFQQMQQLQQMQQQQQQDTSVSYDRDPAFLGYTSSSSTPQQQQMPLRRQTFAEPSQSPRNDNSNALRQARGPPGLPGPTGPMGPPGVSPLVALIEKWYLHFTGTPSKTPVVFCEFSMDPLGPSRVIIRNTEQLQDYGERQLFLVDIDTSNLAVAARHIQCRMILKPASSALAITTKATPINSVESLLFLDEESAPVQPETQPEPELGNAPEQTPWLSQEIVLRRDAKNTQRYTGELWWTAEYLATASLMVRLIA